MSADLSPTAARRILRDHRIVEEAQTQGGVLSRQQIFELGCERWHLEAHLRAGRWRRLGRQTVEVCRGDQRLASWWRGLMEVSPSAVLDGISALNCAGLRGVEEDAVHVAVPKSADPRRCRGVVVHETRRYEHQSVLRDGIPRMRPATAAVHAALWATSDRQAALYVLAAGQQRLFTPAELAEEVVKIRRDRRRVLLRGLSTDLAGGIETLCEREFARLCEARGFPAPSRQVRRQGPGGRVYLDVAWLLYRVAVEIDGRQHLEASSWIGDALKQNVVSMEGFVVLRVPNLALRIDPEPFLDQIEAALSAGGWTGRARAGA